MKLRFQRKRSAGGKNPSSFSKAKSIGILIKNDDQKNNSSIESLVHNLIQAGKKTEVLCLFDKVVNTKYEIPFHTLHKRNFSIWGNPKDPYAQNFLNRDHDFFILLVDTWLEEFRPFLERTRKGYVIGNPDKIPMDHLDLALKPQNGSLGNFSSMIWDTLKKL